MSSINSNTPSPSVSSQQTTASGDTNKPKAPKDVAQNAKATAQLLEDSWNQNKAVREDPAAGKWKATVQSDLQRLQDPALTGAEKNQLYQQTKSDIANIPNVNDMYAPDHLRHTLKESLEGKS